MPLKHGLERSQSARKFERYARFGLLFVLALFGCRARQLASAPAGALVVILPREPEQLDPRYIGDAYGFKVSRLLHASLVKVDPFTLEPVPYLAETVTLDGPTRYRVKLRSGLRFADGSALDADDVVATFRGLVDPRVKSRLASTFSRVHRVTALSPTELLFELDEAHASFLTDLEFPILRAEDALEPARPGRLPVGAGPYRLRARQTGLLSLSRNGHYHGAPAAHPELRLVIVHDDNTRALRMLAGAGDLALNAVPPLLLPLFERPGFRVQSELGAGTTYLGVNLDHPVLRDLRVRQAIAHAIDRQSLIAHKLFGRARLASSWISPSHWAYAHDTPAYGFDRERARRLLDQAGRRPNAKGVRLSLTVRTSSERGVISMARALASMLREVGIELDVRPSETATLLADLSRGRFELSYLQSPDVIEPHVLSWFFASDRIPELGKREGANRWRMRDPELDRALEQGRSRTDRAGRLSAYATVQRVLAHRLPVIPLWHEDVVAVTSHRLASYRVPRDARALTTLADPPARGTP